MTDNLTAHNRVARVDTDNDVEFTSGNNNDDADMVDID